MGGRLGLQATSVRIYRGLVPGITNVTNRLRYYSFYCWVVLAYERHEHADDKNRWRRFIRRAEALYALASYAASTAETGGMAGREWVEKEWPTIEASNQADLTLHDDPKVENYLGAARGNFGQFYVASMIDVGLLAKSRGVPLIGPDGRILARAFEASSGDVAKLMADAVLSGTVSVSDLAPIGQAAGPHVISDESEEMRLLRNFIEGRGGRLGSARCNSAWLLLEYLRRLDGGRYDEEGAREAFYNRVMPDGSPFQPRSPILLGWRAYEANELCHSALAALFNGMMATAARLRRPAPHRGTSLRCFCSRGPSLRDCFRCSSCWATRSCLPAMPPNPANPHLPPHLREVCSILAAGLLRLRSRAAEEAAREAADQGERGLHFPAPQRLDANRTNRRPA